MINYITEISNKTLESNGPKRDSGGTREDAEEVTRADQEKEYELYLSCKTGEGSISFIRAK